MLKLLFRWLGATEVQAGYYMTRTSDSKQQEGLRPPGQKSTTLCWSPLCWLLKWRALLNGACVLSARVWTIPHPSVPLELEGRQRLSHIQHPTRSQVSRKRPSQQTDQICRNFNRNACMADPCKYNHTCLGCFRPGHSIRNCQDFIKGKGKTPAGDKIFHPKGSQGSSTN